MKSTTFHKRGRQTGFALIEALVALLVMSFGMLALSGMQMTLARSADIAKQRTEAMRLAQRKIDEYRSFTSILAAAGHTIVWNTLPASGTEPVVTNASYTVATTLAGAISDAMRPVSVQVSWVDRANQTQSITISSVISKSDPIDIGYVANPLPLNAPLKRPKNRNINIPIPALDLNNGDGQSSTQLSSNYVIVYSNVTAGVVKICNPGVANATAAQINSAILAGLCTDVSGYIVAGYVGRTAGSVAWPTGINVASLTRNTAFAGYNINCLYSDAADQNTGSVITVNNGYKYYLCVVPVSAPFLWGGTLRLGGVSTTSNYMVCRYQYAQTDVTANERNVQPYVNVNLSMDEQNYQVVTSSSVVASSLAGLTTACPAAMTVTDTTVTPSRAVSVGVVHQDCRVQNPNRATECPAATTFP